MTGSGPLSQLARDLADNARARAWFLGPRPPRSASAPPPSGGPEPSPGPDPGAGAPPAEPPGPGPADGAPRAHPAAACASLDALADAARACRRCRLCTGRTTVVVGEGAPRARLMFVGEAPGRDEDLQGRPFVGRSGQLLTRMIAAMGLRREEVFIANVLKCRPPENRDPQPDEAAACRPWLERQVELIDPEVICTLGRHALSALAGEALPMGRSRGRSLRLLGRTVVPTYHPAYLLRNPAAKRDAWSDLRKVMGLLGLPRPGERGGSEPAGGPSRDDADDGG